MIRTRKTRPGRVRRSLAQRSRRSPRPPMHAHFLSLCCYRTPPLCLSSACAHRFQDRPEPAAPCSKPTSEADRLPRQLLALRRVKTSWELQSVRWRSSERHSQHPPPVLPSPSPAPPSSAPGEKARLWDLVKIRGEKPFASALQRVKELVSLSQKFLDPLPGTIWIIASGFCVIPTR